VGEAVDEGSAFQFFRGELLDLLLVGGLVGVEAVLDGENVLVDGDAVAEELSRRSLTFSSWSICPCFSISFSCSSFSSIYRYFISSCRPLMYWSYNASLFGLFFSRSILELNVEDSPLPSKPYTFLCDGEATWRILRDWLRCSDAADLLFFMGRRGSAISISLYRREEKLK
jgi:hypothetical protein